MASLPHRNRTLETCWTQGLDNFAQLENKQFLWGGFLMGTESARRSGFCYGCTTDASSAVNGMVVLCTSNSCFSWQKSPGQSRWSAINGSTTGFETASYSNLNKARLSPNGIVRSSIMAIEVASDSQQVLHFLNNTRFLFEACNSPL